MKKISLLLFIFAAALMTGCNKEKLQAQQQTIDSLANANNMSAAEIQGYVEFVNSMSQSLDYINQAETTLYSNNEGSPKEQREAVKEKLKNLSEVVTKQREQLAKLEADLKSKGMANSKLMVLVESMKKQLEEKDAQIAQLQQEIENNKVDIANLKTNVETLTTANNELTQTVQEQADVITTQTDLMNEAYIRVGSKSDLKAAGLLSGGFLKKSKLNANNIDNSKFQKIDIRNFSEVQINSKSPKVVSQMPVNSYTIEKTANGSVLKVVDPAKFWSLTNYLIIQL